MALLATSDAGARSLYRGSPENYRRLIPLLRPGDTLALSAGVYRRGLPVHHMSGEAGKPIVISGPRSGPVALFVARAGHNTVSIVDSRHVAIRNLVLDGGGLAVDAVKAEGHARWAHDITLENLVIRGHGNNQQTVAISTKCPAWNWVIRGSTVVGAGTGMYLGNSDGSAPFVAGLIERNVVLDTVGYNLQIKHQRPRVPMEGLPAAPSTTIIRHNVFAKSEGGSAEMARPNVLVGHFPLQGQGAEDQYAIYGNFFYQNRHEALFQGEGNVALYSNLFVNRHGDAIRIQPHNDIPRRIDVAFNTVLAAGAGISVRQKEGAPVYRQAVLANAVFAAAAISGGERSGNLEAPLAKASTFLRRPFAAPGELDLRPRRALAGRAMADAERTFPDWDRDFDGRARAPGSIGAYGAAATRSRWRPQLERKPE